MHVSHAAGTWCMKPLLATSEVAEPCLRLDSFPHRPEALIDALLPVEVSSALALSPFTCTNAPGVMEAAVLSEFSIVSAGSSAAGDGSDSAGSGAVSCSVTGSGAGGSDAGGDSGGGNGLDAGGGSGGGSGSDAGGGSVGWEPLLWSAHFLAAATALLNFAILADPILDEWSISACCSCNICCIFSSCMQRTDNADAVLFKLCRSAAQSRPALLVGS